MKIDVNNNFLPYGIFRDLIGPGPDAKAMCHALDPVEDETRQRIYAGFLQFKYNSKTYTALQQLKHFIHYAQPYLQVPNWHEQTLMSHRCGPCLLDKHLLPSTEIRYKN